MCNEMKGNVPREALLIKQPQIVNNTSFLYNFRH